MGGEVIDERMNHARLERGRWEIIRILHVGGRLGATETMMVTTLLAMWPQTTRDWIRDQLTYLEDRKLVKVERHAIKDWRATLSHHGVDLATYVSDCQPGIDRPAKYWGDAE
ncbi:MAG: hypothetical protein OXU42_03940 [Deltaproteobacteria bacterium]|nr:hypothetical protein [Deltaproteobacteria bacterium]